MFIAVINNIIVLLGFDQYVQWLAKGIIIILAMVLDQRLRSIGQ
jgi:ribose/xylose/arabinose/galactoside ABC-type transport system permease subunit